MRLSISKSPNSTSLYVIKSTYEKGKHSSKVVEKLGTYAALVEKLGGQDPIEWAKQYVEELNRKEKKGTQEILVPYSPTKRIPKGEQRSFNGGYLVLQKIYHQLKLHEICKQISDRHKFCFDLDSILSRLLYARVIFPASKLATQQLATRFMEQPNFELQHLYRALEIIAEETEFIQSQVYKNSISLQKRKTGVLYYDCTNYFFEIEQEDGIKQYGFSKAHRPNPIVQMGLFIDGDGIPLAFSIQNGNTNEQLTLTPLEERILSDYKLSKFIVCTDAGLASTSNRKFNDRDERAFVTAQSVKKLKKHLKEWALARDGWRLPDSTQTYDIEKLDEEKDKDKTFYKERWIKEDGLEQKLIVTYSIKYKNYQRQVRTAQVERAQKMMTSNPSKINQKRQNDYRRFVEKIAVTQQGEIAKKDLYHLNTSLIAQEEAYDGFYAVATNLEDDAPAIIRLNHRRWEIEECFRIMKSEFKARPIYLSREDRIKAHFTTCFLALLLYRLLEKKLEENFTSAEIIHGLRNMNFCEIKGNGYIPAYTRTDFTDALHEKFGFRTDFQIIHSRQMRKILKSTKE